MHRVLATRAVAHYHDWRAGRFGDVFADVVDRFADFFDLLPGVGKHRGIVPGMGQGHSPEWKLREQNSPQAEERKKGGKTPAPRADQ